jgi:hypothetical protein
LKEVIMVAVVNPRIPHVALGQVFERVNKRGEKYLVGRLGIAKLLIVPSGEVSRGEAIWKIFLGEGLYDQENAKALSLAQVED